MAYFFIIYSILEFYFRIIIKTTRKGENIFQKNMPSTKFLWMRPNGMD